MELIKNSAYFVKMLEQLDKDYKDIEASIQYQNKLYDKKIQIINEVNQYNSSLIEKITKLNHKNPPANDLTINSNKILFTDTDNIIESLSLYSSYGNCIHPKIVGTLNNVFNLETSIGYMFKNNATVTVNDKESEEFTSIIKHDSIENKVPYFEVYNNNVVTVKIIVPKNSLIGETTCNMIEISPFLPGGAILENILIESMEGTEYNSHQTLINYSQPIENTRIVLSKNYAVQEITLVFRLIYKNSQDLYPFGLKHIYLLNANLDKNSRIVLKSSYTKLLKQIGEHIYLSDQYSENLTGEFSKHDTTYSAEKIKLYSHLANDKLLFPIETYTNTSMKQISRNTKNFYADIPINKSMYSIEFREIKFV